MDQNAEICLFLKKISALGIWKEKKEKNE